MWKGHMKNTDKFIQVNDTSVRLKEPQYHLPLARYQFILILHTEYMTNLHPQIQQILYYIDSLLAPNAENVYAVDVCS